MKVAIHHIDNSFSERWISYCEENKISYEMVNLFDSQIISKLLGENFTHVMCQVPNEDARLTFALSGIFDAIESIGLKTFPSKVERWHFDNKIYQKYLLEAHNFPFVKTDVFYHQQEASEFLNNCNYPIVAKLKRGAGAVNVSLLKHEAEAKQYVETMFSKGINPTPKVFENLKDKAKYAKKYSNPKVLVQKGIGYFKRIKEERTLEEKEKGYVLFQEFMPNNDFDTRIVVSNNMAFGLIRKNRENDFRASGSGEISYDPELIDTKMIEIAFNVSDTLGFSLMGYDFIYDQNRNPVIVEFCYAFTANAYDHCIGYWDKDLQFHSGTFAPHKQMIDSFLFTDKLK